MSVVNPTQPNPTSPNYLIIDEYIYNKNILETSKILEIPLNILKLPKRILTLKNDQNYPKTLKNYPKITLKVKND